MASIMLVFVPPSKRVFSFTLLVLSICLALLLFVLPLKTMRFYVPLYNITASILAFGLLVDEIYRIWHKDVQYEPLEPEA